MNDLLDLLKSMKPQDDEPAPNSGQPKPESKPPEPYVCGTCNESFSSAKLLSLHAVRCIVEAEKPKPKPEPQPEPEGLQPEGKWKNSSGTEEQLQEFDRVIRHTEKATLFGINDRCFWLPKSKYKHEGNQIIAPEWMQLTLKRIRTK